MRFTLLPFLEDVTLECPEVGARWVRLANAGVIASVHSNRKVWLARKEGMHTSTRGVSWFSSHYKEKGKIAMATSPGGTIFPAAGNGYHVNCPTLPHEVSHHITFW